MTFESRTVGKALWISAVASATVVFVAPLFVNFPLLDPDEGLHAAIAQEIVERGDWITPHFLGEPFLDKPIFYFWFQATSLKVFGMNETAIRLVGLFWGLLGATATGWLAWRMFNRTVGLVSFAFYSTMILPAALSQAAAHDVALIPFVVLALGLFFEAERLNGHLSLTLITAAIGVALGLSVLAKGFVGAAIVGVAYGSYLLFTKRLTWAVFLRGAAALVVAALTAGGWYLAVEAKTPGYLYYFFVERHLLGFATAGQRHGGEPFWYYLPIIFVGGMPWLNYGLITLRDWRERKTRDAVLLYERLAVALLFCWAISGFLLLSAASSKLITYVWPVFPPLAVLSAIGWARLLDGTLSVGAKEALRRSFTTASFVGPAVLPIVFFVVASIYKLRFGFAVISAAFAVGCLALVPLAFLRREKHAMVFATSIASFAAQFLLTMFVVLPPIAETISAKDLALHYNKQGVLPHRVCFAEERIGSFVFYLEPRLRASIAAGQLREIKIDEEFTPAPGDVIVTAATRLNRAKRYLKLDDLKRSDVGHYAVFEKQ